MFSLYPNKLFKHKHTLPAKSRPGNYNNAANESCIMAKAIECVTELNEEQAREFLKILANPRPTHARDEILEDIKKYQEIFRRVK